MKFHCSLYFASAFVATLLNANFAQADTVLDWNEMAVAAVATSRPPDGARALAMMHVAMFDAVNAIEQKYRLYAYPAKGSRDASSDAAATAAAHAVLSKLFPDQTQTFDGAYAASLSKIPEGSAKAAGVALGREVGSQCLAMRANDGAGGASTYKQKITPGVYVPTAFVLSSEFGKV
ncbi:MAG TPA: hypothetical protein VGN65_02680, partial [Casimicrobiaceae bacterium]